MVDGNTSALGPNNTADIMKEPSAAVLWKPRLLIWISFLITEGLDGFISILPKAVKNAD